MSIFLKGASTVGGFLGILFTTERLTIDLTFWNIFWLIVCAVIFSWGLHDLGKKGKNVAVKGYNKFTKKPPQ